MCTPAHSFGVGMFVAGMKVASSGALKKVVQIFRNTTKQ